MSADVSDRGGLDRRQLVGGLSLALAAAGAAQAADAPDAFAYVGARTTRARNARGDGINVFRVNAKTGAWTVAHHAPAADNPSFLAMSRDGARLYAAHGDGSMVSAFVVRGDGALTPLNSQATGGTNVAHLTLDPTGRWVIAANHYSSTVAVLPVAADGALRPMTDLVTLKGVLGPRRDEQPYAKPHQIVFDPTGQILAVPDKGVDRVFTFRLSNDTGKLTPAAPPAVALMGSGPRHIAFHPRRPFAYLLCEMASSVTAMTFDSTTGALAPFQILPGVPDNWVMESRASEIAVDADGRFLYLSNRGHDSIAAFAIDAATGRLQPVGWISSGGKTPRFFALSPDGRFLFVANEDSDTIVSFSVDRRTGRLARTAAEPISIGSPTCIVFGRRVGS